jgi:hypothetical protein
MKTLHTVSAEDKRHFIQCSLCDHYYDMRDRVQRLAHTHTQHNTIATELATRQRVAMPAAPPIQTGMINLRKDDNE